VRRSPRNVRIAYNHGGLTHFGGIYFFHEFLRVLQFRNFLAQHLRYPRRNHRYSLSQTILALVYPVVLGLDVGVVLVPLLLLLLHAPSARAAAAPSTASPKVLRLLIR